MASAPLEPWADSAAGQTEMMVVAGEQVTAGDSPPSSTFASLAVVPYRRLFVSGLIAFLAVQSQLIARGWLANELTGTNTGLGGVYMAFGVPMLIATPFGGVIADRLSKRLVIAACQLALAITSAWIGLGVALNFVDWRRNHSECRLTGSPFGPLPISSLGTIVNAHRTPVKPAVFE